MSEACLYLRSIVQGVNLATLYDNLAKNRQDFVAQGIVEVVPSNHFINKRGNWSRQRVYIPIGMIVEICLAAPASRV